ncbi:MAG: DUF5686 family protein [Chitinophagales bacterium]
MHQNKKNLFSQNRYATMRNLMFILFFGLLANMQPLFAQTTTVSGTLLDQKTREPLPFASVVFMGSTVGTTTDIDGNFSLSSDNLAENELAVSYLGYQQQKVHVTAGINQTITILMLPDAQVLQEVVIKKKRRVKKDTAAITLYRRVLKNKGKNQSSHLNSYAYEDYTKTEFDLFNIKESLTNRRILKPFSYIFDNIDTTENGKPYLPVLLKERIADIYYTKEPKKQKEIVKADQFSGVDDKNMSELVDDTFDDIDIYQNVADLSGKGFLLPFSKGALASYKFFLSDSTMLEGEWCYKLEFTPRRKQDLCFTGHAWIHDETAAIKSIELQLLNQTNLNYVSDLKIRQGFTFHNKKQWFKNKEQMEVQLNITKKEKHQSIRILKTSSRRNIRVNEPLSEKLWDGESFEIKKDAYEKSPEFWDKHRHASLTKTESGIYTMVERVQSSTAYKTYEWLGRLGSSGYMRAGPVEFGRVIQYYSYNAIEGHRFRFGVRTNPKRFRDKYMLDGYLAYGTKDKLLKYHAGFNKHLKRVNNRWHLVGGYYRFDFTDYNTANSYMTHDHILASFLRKEPLSSLDLLRQGHFFYEKEWKRGVMSKFSATHKMVYTDPILNGEVNTKNSDISQALELNTYFRWGLGQKFLERGSKRVALAMSTPTFEIDYTFSPKIKTKNGLDTFDNFHRLKLKISQRLTTRVGRTDYTITGERVFGVNSNAFLTRHRGNGNILHNRHLYNSWSDEGYMSDVSASYWIRHRFDGLIFNAIPLVRKMKLRSILYSKGVYGKVLNSDLAVANPLNGFYAEAGVGVENIAKFLHVYFIQRMTQLDDPAVSKYAIKIYISPSF